MKKILLYSSLLAAALTASAQVILIDEDFDSLTAPALPTSLTTTSNVATVDDSFYAQSGSVTLWIVDTTDSNFFTTEALGLVNGTTTESTIAFAWTTDVNQSSKFGRIPQLEWSNDGTTFFNVDQIGTIPTTTGATLPAYTAYTFTVNAADEFGGNIVSFSADSAWRVVGDNDSGGGGGPLIIDNFSVTADAVPEPSSFALLSGCLALTSIMLRRRRD